MDKKQGRLIVIEGIDGSGKTTQIDLLVKYLSDRNIPFETISFPQYGKNEYADKVYDYLSGKFGEVDPYSIAKVYAADRKTVKDLINNWLNAGKLVIVNRYVSSSKAHLGANLKDVERENFMEWIDRLEYQTNGMPKLDLNILLKVDPKIGQQNSQVDHRVDIHEQSIKHEEKATQIYFELSQAEEDWVVVDCMDDGKMKPPEKIQQDLLSILSKYAIIKS